jgi:two-component system sensor histidine kinase MprB
MSLRARLVTSTAAAVAIAIVLASAIVYVLVAGELRGQLKQQLRQDAATIASQPLGFAVPITGHPNEFTLGNEVPLVDYYQLVTANGHVYIPYDYNALTPLPITAQARAAAAGTTGQFYYDTEFDGTRTLVLADPLRIAFDHAAYSEPAVLEVAVPLTSLNNELSRIQLLLVIISLAGIGLAAGAALLIARSTLRPVRRLSDTAERVRATRDLSERIAVEGDDELSQLARTFNEMLAALDEAALRQQRLVQDASHELRTPLTSLRTNIEVLAAGGALTPEDRAQLLHDVIAQLGEMTALIGELTELARGSEQPPTFETVALDLVVQESVERTLRNHPEVRIETEIEPTVTVGSPAGLERAIVNLLDNAAKWSPPGATVEVGLRDRELTVRDHGPGIAEADAPHVFERFYRATSARSMPGSGLGLAIVSRVAEAHNATITVERAAGGGTLMRLRFPPVGAAAAAGAATTLSDPEGFDGEATAGAEPTVANGTHRRGSRLRSRLR